MFCPICKNEHMTESKYSTTVCEDCLIKYPLMFKDKVISFKIINDVLYSISNGITSCNYDCILNGYHCYATMNNFGKIFIIVCKPINKVLEKIKKF